MTSTLPKTEEEQFLLIDRDGNIVYEQGTREMYRVGERLEDILWKNRNLTETSAEIVRTAQGRFLSVATEIDDEFTLVWLISYRHLTGSMTRVGFLFGNWSACGDHRTTSRAADVESCIQSDRRDGADCQRGGIALRGNGETAGEYGAVQHRPDLSDDGAETEPYQPAQRAGGSCSLSNQQRENRKIAGVGGRDLRQAGCRIRVVVMRLSDIQDLHSNNTEEAIAFEMETIKTIVEQTLRELGNVLVLPVDREFIAVILFSEESVTEERVTVASQHILEVTGELIHIGMDVGISGEKGETEGFAELNLMYQMARAATAYRFIYGMGAVVTEGEMAQRALNGNRHRHQKN